MPCWIRRASELRLKVPADPQFERDLMMALGVYGHEELEGRINSVPDEELVRIFTELVRRRKRATDRYLEEQGGKVEPVYYA